MSGRLYLLPNLLDDATDHERFLPAYIQEVIAELDGVICESEKQARRFLSRFKRANMPLRLLNEHTKPNEIVDLLTPLEEGKRWGLLSDAGLPCIADPGSLLVSLAHKRGIQVDALVGPCSIIMALMLSGFSGQRFSFHGYLSREPEERKRSILALEQKSRKEKSTEIFIEAPYRNQELLQHLVAVLHQSSHLACVCDITSPSQKVYVGSLVEWKKKTLPDINKHPCVFLIYTEEKPRALRPGFVKSTFERGRSPSQTYKEFNNPGP